MTRQNRWRAYVAVVLCALFAASASRYGDAQAAPSDLPCVGEYSIDETLPSGARWVLCWQVKTANGLTLEDMTYTPPGESLRRFSHQPLLLR